MFCHPYRLLRSVVPAVLLLASYLSFSTALAHEGLRPFVSGSLAKIAAERQGKPFIVALWSVGCTHCPAELKALGEFRKKQPRLDVVLVSADSPEDAPQAMQLATGFGLKKSEQWIFADDMPERLRFEIDPRWHGELPRTLLYDSAHRITAVSGVIAHSQLDDWIKRNLH